MLLKPTANINIVRKNLVISVLFRWYKVKLSDSTYYLKNAENVFFDLKMSNFLTLTRRESMIIQYFLFYIFEKLYLCGMNNYKILIIDDNQSVLRSLKLVLNGVFRTVVTIADPQLIPALLQAGDVDVVLLDMNFDKIGNSGTLPVSSKLDGEEGLFWLNRINEMPNAPAVVLITAFGDIDLAVRSVQQGAEDFVTKPWDNETLVQKLEAAIAKHRAKLETASLAAQASQLKQQIDDEQNLSLEEIERRHILDILGKENGNLVSAAERLGISRQTLYNKLKKFDSC